MDKTLLISFIAGFNLVITNQLNIFEVNVLPTNNWHFKDPITLELISQKQRVASEFFTSHTFHPLESLVGKKYASTYTPQKDKNCIEKGNIFRFIKIYYHKLLI